MNELGRDARALIDAAHGGDEPTLDDRARVRRALAVTLGGAGSLAATTAAATASAAGGAGSAALGVATPGGAMLAQALAWLAGGAVAGLVVSVPLTVAQRLDDAAPRRAAATAGEERAAAPAGAKRVEAPAAAGIGAGAGEPPETGVSAAAPAASVAATTRGSPAASGRGDDAFAAELESVAGATRALAAGDPERALELLDRTEGAGSVLAEERAAARAIALCDLGRDSEGRAAADAFTGRFPRSPHAPRVAAACSRR